MTQATTTAERTARRLPRLHRDGTVTYWSYYQQRWIDRAFFVPAEELERMTSREVSRIDRHLAPGTSSGD